MCTALRSTNFVIAAFVCSSAAFFVHCSNGGDQDYCSNTGLVSKNSSDMRSNYEYIKFHTKRAGYAELSETMVVSYDNGLYVAGEKVITVSEHVEALQQLSSELQRQLRSELQPPTCIEPNGKYLQHDGDKWVCVCHEGYSGKLCEPPSVAPTFVPTTPLVCTSDWSSFRNSCYRLYPVSVRPSEAQEACQGEGAELVSINDSAENDFVFSLLTAQYTTWQRYVSAWIGAVKSEGQWTWTDNSLWWSNWHPGEPSNSGPYATIVLYHHGGNWGGDWNDNRADEVFPYICKITG